MASTNEPAIHSDRWLLFTPPTDLSTPPPGTWQQDLAILPHRVFPGVPYDLFRDRGPGTPEPIPDLQRRSGLAEPLGIPFGKSHPILVEDDGAAELAGGLIDVLHNIIRRTDLDHDQCSGDRRSACGSHCGVVFGGRSRARLRGSDDGYFARGRCWQTVPDPVSDRCRIGRRDKPDDISQEIDCQRIGSGQTGICLPVSLAHWKAKRAGCQQGCYNPHLKNPPRLSDSATRTLHSRIRLPLRSDVLVGRAHGCKGDLVVIDDIETFHPGKTRQTFQGRKIPGHSAARRIRLFQAESEIMARVVTT